MIGQPVKRSTLLVVVPFFIAILRLSFGYISRDFILTSPPTTPNNGNDAPGQWQPEPEIVSNRIDYTNHSIIKIAYDDMDVLFDAKNHPDPEHEVLWYDNSNVHQNQTFAFVRVGPKSLRRVKRDLHYLRQPAVFVTRNLQSWLDAEHYRQQTFPKSNKIVLASAASHPQRFHLPGSTVDDVLGPMVANTDDTDEPPYLGGSQPPEMEHGGPRPRYSKIVPTFVLNRYHPVARINRFLDDVAARSNGVTVFIIGYTHENRPIKAVEILNNPADPNFLWIDACTHAREWVTVTTALYAIEQAVVTKIPVNMIVVPVLNVDGYEYTWTNDRMWRKNRRPYHGSRLARHSMPERCTGVDLNRNYDINFGGTGSSTNPCSFLYQGPVPFSEPEVRAAADLISQNRHRIKMTLSLHSFNQLWACPNAYTNDRTGDYDHHMMVLKRIQRAVYESDGVMYDIGPLGERLYLGSGFMMDWIYHKMGIRDAYLVELRDRGFYGFMLPSDQIWPTATETWAGIRAAIKHIFQVL